MSTYFDTIINRTGRVLLNDTTEKVVKWLIADRDVSDLRIVTGSKVEIVDAVVYLRKNRNLVQTE